MTIRLFIFCLMIIMTSCSHTKSHNTKDLKTQEKNLNNNQNNNTISNQDTKKDIQDSTTNSKINANNKYNENNDNKSININGSNPKQADKKFIVSEDDDLILLNDDDTTIIKNTDDRTPIMIAIMGPMYGKNSLIGSAITNGAHIGLIELFNQYKIPVRLTPIDTGDGIEDIEFNIGKLDDTKFDVIISFVSEEQDNFIKEYVESSINKPQIMSLLPSECGISLNDQINMLDTQTNKDIYVILPKSDKTITLQSNNVKYLEYTTHDIQTTNEDLINIAKKIQLNNDNNDVMIVFTESNWRLQKLVANIEALRLQNKVQIVLASLSNVNNRTEMVNEKRHKFGNINIIAPKGIMYNKFIKDYLKINNHRPIELSYLAYNAVYSLKNSQFNGNKWIINNNCKPEIMLFEKNIK